MDSDAARMPWPSFGAAAALVLAGWFLAVSFPFLALIFWAAALVTVAVASVRVRSWAIAGTGGAIVVALVVLGPLLINAGIWALNGFEDEDSSGSELTPSPR